MRRGVPTSSPGADAAKQASVFGVLVILGTITLFLFSILVISYTYGQVVATLAAVEDPQPADYEPIDDGNTKDSGKNPHENDLPLVPHVPITAKLRTATKHLKARGGKLAVFRGAGIYLVWLICRTFLTSLFFGHGASPVRLGLAQIFAEVALANVETAWVHVVISEPTAKPWWRRVPGFKTWKAVAPAVAVKAIASKLSFILPMTLGVTFGVFRITDNSVATFPTDNPQGKGVVIGSLSMLVLSLALTFLIEIPATVTMVRVAASVLPADVQTIVPFDRTFNGKMLPSIVSGTTAISLLDAWKTFSWQSRVRYVKLMVKVLCLTTALVMGFASVIVAETIVFGVKAQAQGSH